MELCRWEQRDITAVELHYVGGGFAGWEALDTLEFGPNPPTPAHLDARPPTLSLIAPLDGQEYPESSVGAELESLAVVELLDCADQAEHALLD
jgi:hypothetical protein